MAWLCARTSRPDASLDQWRTGKHTYYLKKKQGAISLTFLRAHKPDFSL